MLAQEIFVSLDDDTVRDKAAETSKLLGRLLMFLWNYYAERKKDNGIIRKLCYTVNYKQILILFFIHV